MSLGKIILASFAVIIGIGLVSFAAMSQDTELQASSEIPNTQIKESEPENTVLEPPVVETQPGVVSKPYPKEPQCTGEARCISGFVTRVIDGDTIVVGDKSIRFALVNTPEWGDYDYSRATNYMENLCPVGSKVLVDEDDGQTQGSFGRIIGKIYCNNLILNEEILEVGHAVILTEFCSVSEFAQDDWAKKHGC